MDAPSNGRVGLRGVSELALVVHRENQAKKANHE